MMDFEVLYAGKGADGGDLALRSSRVSQPAVPLRHPLANLRCSCPRSPSG